MLENSDKTILEILEQGFIIFSKNGIIEYVEIPDHGSIELKSQNGQIVYGLVSTGKQY